MSILEQVAWIRPSKLAVDRDLESKNLASLDDQCCRMSIVSPAASPGGSNWLKLRNDKCRSAFYNHDTNATHSNVPWKNDFAIALCYQ